MLGVAWLAFLYRLSHLTVLMSDWCVHVQNGWNVTSLTGIWHTLVNLVNIADLSLHCWYIGILWQSIAKSANGLSVEFAFLPTAIVIAGLVASYTAAAVLPGVLYPKESQL